MRFAILTVGSELTKGFGFDTNSRTISAKLAEIGLVTGRISTVPDMIDSIITEVGRSLKDFDLLIMTGGLGPTLDDLTREALALFFGQKLKVDPKLSSMIQEKYSHLNREIHQASLKQAEIFPLAKPIFPAQGTAPGLIIENGKKSVIALPGVPTEMEEMLSSTAISYLKKRFNLKDVYLVSLANVSGINEVEIEERISSLCEEFNIDISLIPHEASVEIHLSVCAKEALASSIVEAARARLSILLGSYLIGFDGKRLEEVVGDLLLERGLTLSVAESCTGGLVAKRITDVSGSSKYFLGGAVTYANEAKERLLNVSAKSLNDFGAVSSQVAIEMAAGVADLFSSEIGLSITGIAGPSGGSTQKPVGTVYMALSHEKVVITERQNFSGSRDEIRLKASEAILRILRLHLLEGLSLASIHRG